MVKAGLQVGLFPRKDQLVARMKIMVQSFFAVFLPPDEWFESTPLNSARNII